MAALANQYTHHLGFHTSAFSNDSFFYFKTGAQDSPLDCKISPQVIPATYKIITPAPCSLTTTYPYIHFLKCSPLIILKPKFDPHLSNILFYPLSASLCLHFPSILTEILGFIATTTFLQRASTPLHHTLLRNSSAG